MSFPSPDAGNFDRDVHFDHSQNKHQLQPDETLAEAKSHPNYLKINRILKIAKDHAAHAHQRQAEKTRDALKVVYLAQSEERKEDIGALRQKEYMEAISEQIKADHARDLADEVELLAFRLLRTVKKAEHATIPLIL